jgi:hypothetical protein
VTDPGEDEIRKVDRRLAFAGQTIRNQKSISIYQKSAVWGVD